VWSAEPAWGIRYERMPPQQAKAMPIKGSCQVVAWGMGIGRLWRAVCRSAEIRFVPVLGVVLKSQTLCVVDWQLVKFAGFHELYLGGFAADAKIACDDTGGVANRVSTRTGGVSAR
jgi:hypothetical protein